MSSRESSSVHDGSTARILIPTDSQAFILQCDNGVTWYDSLTHWGRAMHICVSNLIIIASDNGLSPGRRQAIIWTNAGILLTGPLGTIFSEILIENSPFPFTKTRLKVSSAKWWPFCLGLNMLNTIVIVEWALGLLMAWHLLTTAMLTRAHRRKSMNAFIGFQQHLLQYIPRNMHTVLLCFALLWLCSRS